MKDTDRRYPDDENKPAFDYGSEEEGESEREGEQEDAEISEKRGGLKLLTSIQIFGSLAILAAALILRLLGGETYQKVRAWYLSAVNDSIVAEEQINQAERTVVGLWNNLSAAGLQTSAESKAPGESGGTQSQQQAASSAGSGSSAAGTVS